MEQTHILVMTEDEPEEVTQEELKEVLKRNDGDLDRLDDFKDVKMVWGYLCKVGDYFRYSLMDMDKVILFVKDNGEPTGYEHTGEYNPEYKDEKLVIGLMDENAEIEAV